jgi:A/G-specific adenine glycosylase
MLQQTQVDTVIPYYKRFIKKYPNVHGLAKAPLDDVLKLWENLGYYSRARQLHAAAKKIVEDFKGRLPDTYEGLISLPGVGPYTAGAILSIAFNRPIPAIDANVRRVISRLYYIIKPMQDRLTQEKIRKITKGLIPLRQPGHFNQALMDLGALICTPAKPDCRQCPFHQICKAYKRKRQDKIPIKSKRPGLPHKHFTAGIIRKKNEILLVKRPAKGLLGGLWKFPGGENTGKESLGKSLQKTIRNELGVSVQVGPKVMAVDHRYTHFQITLHAFLCSRMTGRPQALGCKEWLWVPMDHLADFTFSKADRMVMRSIIIDTPGYGC